MLWVDKHRPKSLDKLVVHSRIGSQLKRLASSQNGDCPHVLFYGPPGAGKKTLSLAFLRELYGPGVDKLKVEHRNWQIQLPTRKIEVELATVSSNHHLEVNPSEAGRKDVVSATAAVPIAPHRSDFETRTHPHPPRCVCVCVSVLAIPRIDSTSFRR